jgi:adenine-specific DNA-methyltransferase
MEILLKTLWDDRSVITLESDFKRYVGAQIGIFNPKGEKVGQVSHVRNKEFVYIVAPPDVCGRLAAVQHFHGRPISPS